LSPDNPIRKTPHPLLLEIPVRPWLRELSRREGRRTTLANVPEDVLEEIRNQGFQAVWLMGVWRTSPQARRLALSHPELLREYERLLPDWQAADVEGSPYAIDYYEASPSIGGDSELDFFRSRLKKMGLGLVLDFVGNHLACDHEWLDLHPDRLVQGTVRDLARAPSNWFVHFGLDGSDRIFAHGRDPHFDGWSDTVQVDLRRRASRDAHIRTLRDLARRCDGVRCDVAMLLLSDVFRSTWGPSAEEVDGEFWDEAIFEARREHPEFVLIAEAYWGLESKMIELGFDFSYDKGILDALVNVDLAALRQQHLLPFDPRRHRVHFLENHDEMRASARFGSARLAAAQLFVSTHPGKRFFQHGQIEGRRIRTPVQLARAPEEAVDSASRDLHERILAVLRERALHEGRWSPWLPSAADSTVFGNRWSFEDEEWIALVNFGNAAEPAEIPSGTAADIGVKSIFGSRPAPILVQRQAGSLSVTLEPGEAIVLRVGAPLEPLPEESSRSSAPRAPEFPA
jgi:hypothetical protein